MPAPTITPLPTPPSRSQSPETFSTDADAFLGALPDFATDANAQAAYLDALATAVDLDATTASNAAAVAAGAANYQGDYSAGTTYQIGESVSYNGRRYVAKTVNTGVTPAEGANWFLINDGDVLGPVSATNNGIALYDGTTGKIIKSGLNNGTAGQALISGGAGNAPVWGSVEGGSLSFTASGSITAGNPVCLRSDGAVEVATGFSQSETLGSVNGFSFDGSTRRIAYPIFGTSEFVVFSRNNLNTATAIHATVSGQTVTANTFNTVPWAGNYPNNEVIGCCYDPVSGKYLVAWGISGSIQAAVMTVSGTSITFGTPITLVSGLSSGQWANVTYDSLRQQLIVGYYGIAPSSNRNFGIVAVTITGTTPIVGHSLLILNQLVGIVGAEVAYDATVNRLIFYFSDTNNSYTYAGIVSNSGTAFSGILSNLTVANFYGGSKNLSYDPTSNRWILVGATAPTSSGNAAVVAFSLTASTITASSVVTATVGSTNINNCEFTRVAYDSYTQRHVVAVYTQLNQVFYSTVNATGAAPSFGTFASTPTSSTRTPEVVYVSGQNRSVLIYYRDSVNGQAQTYQPAASYTNTQNFIGIATQSVSNGQTVSVTINGGRNTNVTGLTTGANYFLDNNGALTTAGGVRVGEALSATSILVEGKLAGAGTPSASTFLRGDGSWAMPGNLVLVASVPVTAVQTLTIDNVFTTEYENYLIYGQGIVPSYDGEYSLMRFIDRSNGAALTSSYYSANAWSGASMSPGGSSTSGPLRGSMGNNVSFPVGFEMVILNASLGPSYFARQNGYWPAAGQAYPYFTQGGLASTGVAIRGFQILNQNNAFRAMGRILVFGMKA